MMLSMTFPMSIKIYIKFGLPKSLKINFNLFKSFKPLKCGACPCGLHNPLQLGHGGFGPLALKHFPFSKYSQILANFKNLDKFDLKSEIFETNFIA
jgi:hypothetical protein